MNPVPPEIQQGPFETPEAREAMQNPWQHGEALRDQAQHWSDHYQQQLPPGSPVPRQSRDFAGSVQGAQQERQRQAQKPGQRKGHEIKKPPETITEHLMATVTKGIEDIQNAQSPSEAFKALIEMLGKIGELFDAAKTNGKLDWKKLNAKYVPASAASSKPAENPKEVDQKRRESVTEIERQIVDEKKKIEEADKQIAAINADASLKDQEKETQRKPLEERRKKLEEERKNLLAKKEALNDDDVRKKLQELSDVIAQRTGIGVRFNIAGDPMTIEVDLARVPDADREMLRQRLMDGGNGVQGLGFSEKKNDPDHPKTYVWQVKP